ncbi:MAG: FtsL-like putative cell division protein [Chloroherpetonaceae bacterium]|nr:FtsL-like putative cell division protein [Chloroherpetonaceae bacterium]MDW8437646.1 FtsL-like putative cell division protein [Chloroherpetonaceae bacterium]
MKTQIFDERIGRADYGVGVVEEAPLRKSHSQPFVEEAQASGANGAEPKPAEKPKKKLRDEAREKIESILNLRAFLAIAGATALLGLYIYNVISINRLAGETESLRRKIDEVRSLNIERESELNALTRSETIGREAHEKLGLRVSTVPPIELKAE